MPPQVSVQLALERERLVILVVDLDALPAHAVAEVGRTLVPNGDVGAAACKRGERRGERH